MKYVNYSIGALCVIIMLLSTTCTKSEFDNPLDPKGDNYLYGDLSDEERKIASQDGSGSGLFSNRCVRYTLITNASPASGGAVSRSPNQTNYLAADQITITVTATANPEYDFVNWTGAPATVDTTSPSISFYINSNTNLTANFMLKRYTLTTGASPANGGSVQRNPDQELYEHGTPVNVIAMPAYGYRFTGWTGAPTSVDATNPSISFNIGNNMTLTANFEREVYHTLTTSANPSVGGTVSPDSASTHRHGASVTVMAEAAQGYEFTRWTGRVPATVNATDAVITFEMQDDVTLFANFRPDNPTLCTLVTRINPVGGGTVSRSPNQQTFDSGTLVTVTATENPGYEFVNWTGGPTSFERTFDFEIYENTNLTANFKRVYTLTTSATPTAGGSVTPTGITTHDAGATVTVTATQTASQAANYRFTGWSDGETIESRPVIMNSNVTLTANFELITYTLTIEPPITTGGGTGGTVSPVAGTTTRNAGTSVTVTATAESGYRFTGWSGTGAPTPATTNPVTVNMDDNKTLTANFIRQWTLSINRNPTDGGTVSDAGTYDHGASVTVTAMANPDYRFTGWSDGVTNTPRTVPMTSNVTLTANFQQIFLTDARDGARYRIVDMPDGKTWMAENLNYQTADSWCYDDLTANCNTYGRLYTWSAAMSACPAGWHLPSDEEWSALISAVGGSSNAGTQLKSTSGWNNDHNGADTYGFSALPGGRTFRNNHTHGHAGWYGYWWSASEDDLTAARYRFSYDGTFDKYWEPKTSFAFSVRCVRN